MRDPHTDETHFARIKVPSTMSRLVPLKPLDPDELLPPTTQKFVWVEQVIAANPDRLFSRHGNCGVLPLPHYP
ncbi:MAG: hypothetical protein M5U14_19715 [Acidimicrobiia bacterium]|nr:hypothetical protein [Acidimicrobiia bacterium]